jgi:hypothetical protein
MVKKIISKDNVDSQNASDIKLDLNGQSGILSKILMTDVTSKNTLASSSFHLTKKATTPNIGSNSFNNQHSTMLKNENVRYNLDRINEESNMNLDLENNNVLPTESSGAPSRESKS